MQLPDSFAEYTRALLGEEEYTRLSIALLGEEQPVSIRLNPQKCGRSPFSILHSQFSIKDYLCTRQPQKTEKLWICLLYTSPSPRATR